jgi:adenylate cyclase
VNAVACAVDIQQGMSGRNTDVPEDRRIEFRIGVNLGDVVVEDGDIFGDGVNVAARLEGIAEPGGICISATAREHVGNRLDVAFEDAGEQHLKNIERPIRVFRVKPAAAPSSAPHPERIGQKPSIAVLPFSNMSGDPEQEYFADGMTEDLITDLSKVSGLSVIARNSVFAYKGKSADIREVSRHFGVATVLEGSVRKAGQRVRINAQLIDGKDGTHLWADRYDRDLTDIFALQDDITKTIVDQLKVRLLPAERRAIEAPPTLSIDAYNHYLQGRHFYHLHSTPHARLAQRLFHKAVELDPRYARAYAGLADCAWFLFTNHQHDATADEIMSASMTGFSSIRRFPRLTLRTALPCTSRGAAPTRWPNSTRRSRSTPICSRPFISTAMPAATRTTRRAPFACTRAPPNLRRMIAAPSSCRRRCCAI